MILHRHPAPWPAHPIDGGDREAGIRELKGQGSVGVRGFDIQAAFFKHCSQRHSKAASVGCCNERF